MFIGKDLMLSWTSEANMPVEIVLGKDGGKVG